MNGKELITTYPLATEVVREWFLDKMGKSIKADEVPDDFKEYIKRQGISDYMVESIIDTHPRNLFDIFDENNIYIDIRVCRIHKTDVVFIYKILSGDSKGFSIEFYSHRKDAEQVAVCDAFKLLNEKLCKK